MKKNLLVCVFYLLVSKNGTAQPLYFPPLAGTAWDSIVPQDIGYCQPGIDSLYNYLQAKSTKSFMLLKDGKRVLEKYFGTYTRDSLWYWASASKSLASFITGMAQKQGYIDINNKVSQYLGTGWTSAPLAKENLINVKDLLKMTSGLDDNPPSPCDNEDTAKSCLLYLSDATTRWAYHTGAYRKVQDVVSSAVGQNYNVITNNWIKTKIGMSSGIWIQQVFYSKARDMARFGLLCLNKGIWANDTILKDSVYFKNMVNTSQNLNKAYGYLWWLNGKSSFMVPQSQITFTGTLMPNAPSDMFCALGKNDQKIYVVPSQNIVIVRQGNTAGGFNLAPSAFDNTLWGYLNRLSCVTGLNENAMSPQFKMYPNPAGDEITIENANGSASEITITTTVGAEVYNYKNVNNVPSLKISLQGFEKGTYFVSVRSQNGSVVTRKMVKG